MNLGIDDAVEWAHRFTHHTLDGYSASRHAVGKETIRTSERARKLVTNPSYLRRVAVAWGLRVIAAIPPLRRRAAQQFLGG